ncbi:serine hydrolase domain-containing protein [Planctomicrobium sp. SH668]|uniref:serine hydrolase domain-containing protein n=1 Tax=Planctomicrobium sp. SH668 TaxID=3448126 RepID=UPI003F5AE476
MSLPDLQIAPPELLGISLSRWEKVLELASSLQVSGAVPAISLEVQRRGLTTGAYHFGSTRLSSYQPVDDRTLYLLASLTKPIVAMGVMLLVERGQLSLNQPVNSLISGIQDPAKRPLTVKHLLTHTSGLPDTLPNNLELRQSGASLKKFVAETLEAELNFPPGRTAQYQSMGFTLLGEIIERVTGLTCSQFLMNEVFTPLGMTDSYLGITAGADVTDRIAEVRVPAAHANGVTWNWNSPYWRSLGAPWGGAFASTNDVSRFLHSILAASEIPVESRLFAPSTVREAIGNRLGDFPNITDSEIRTRGWGLGWRLNWKEHRSVFCDLLGPEIAGHWGASGTVFWIDLKRQIGVVILTTAALDEKSSPLVRLSNLIAAAFRED